MPEPQLEGQRLQASLTVKDLPRSVAWYADVLGFSVAQRSEKDGKLFAVTVDAGAVRVVLHQDDGAKGWDRVKGVGISLTISTGQDIDAVARRVKAHGSALESEPRDMPWGARSFRVRDPDGFLWTVSRAHAA